jgi:uncharacterized protein YlxW (UPF0749 family)
MSSPAEQQQERISVGLIEYLSRHTLDEDYQRVARDRPAGARAGGFSVLPLLLTLGLFGLLVYTAASQTTRNATTEERDRAQLIQQVNAKRSNLDARYAEVARLRRDNKALDNQFLIGSRSGSGVFATLQRLSTLTGATRIAGPGVRVVVDDAPNATSDRNKVLDSDLQKLVNGLWESGVEAISINGQRVTNLSSIRQAGAAINLNYRPLTAPYTVLAIGDPKTIPSRFAETTHGATWFDLEQQVGLRFSMKSDSSLTLPAADQLSLRYATRIKKETR